MCHCLAPVSGCALNAQSLQSLPENISQGTYMISKALAVTLMWQTINQLHALRNAITD